MSASNIERALVIAETLAKPFEGFRSKPYLCPAGYWTQGYGTVNKPDGSTVKQGDSPISEATASEWLRVTMARDYLPGVLKRSPHLVHYPEVLGALADFAYNLGVARYRASTLSTRVNSLDWRSAVTELHRWNRGGGVVLRGLALRRSAEARYFPGS